MGGLFTLLITNATLEKPFNFSAINCVPKHQAEVQAWNVAFDGLWDEALDGLWEEAPERWRLVFPGRGELYKANYDYSDSRKFFFYILFDLHDQTCFNSRNSLNIKSSIQYCKVISLQLK